MRILIVDDDAVDRQDIKRALSKHIGSVIKEATSASEALFMIMNIEFDVVLLDYMLPDKDGLEVLAEVQNLNLPRPCGIVMMSNLEDESLLENCLQFGAQDFISKREINAAKLKRCILLTRKRFELEYYVRKSVEHSKYLSKTDVLTGLKNRYSFEESLSKFISRNDRDIGTALIFLDIDNFKFFNQSYGHEVGDGLLKQVAKKLPDTYRDKIDVSRVGSNEFAVILQTEHGDDAAKVTLNSILKILSGTFYVDGREINCTFSVGYVHVQKNNEDKNDVIKSANIALAKAKQRFGMSVSEFDDSLLDEIERFRKIKEGIRKHLEKKDFSVAYQPILNQNEVPVSFEALVRWPTISEEGSFGPDEFIPIAEQSNDINRLGSFVFTEAVKTLKRVTEEMGLPMTVSVNLSPIQLNQWDLCESLKALCDKHQMPPADVVLEITETALLNNDYTTTKVLGELAEAGFTISLDDFGTGYSSISHLLNYPIHQVKIDRSVVPEDIADEKRINLISSLVQMCKSVGARVVTEGIEYEWQRKLCADIESHKMQGYYFSRPLPQHQLLDYLAQFAVQRKNLAVIAS
ncbi:MAG: putative bifunctional diguanylate cyclase/phosphodiesterase [Aestuariibacter sp.]